MSSSTPPTILLSSPVPSSPSHPSRPNTVAGGRVTPSPRGETTAYAAPASSPSSSRARARSPTSGYAQSPASGRAQYSSSNPPPFNPQRFERPGLSVEEVREIKEAFDLFDVEKTGTIAPNDLKNAIMALGWEARNQTTYQLLSDLDRNASHALEFDEFLDMMTARLSEGGRREDINKVFRLFDDDQTGTISLENLERVANDLGERMSVDELKEMIERADGDGDGLVTMEDFYNIMSRKALP